MPQRLMLLALLLLAGGGACCAASGPRVLRAEDYRRHFDRFNAADSEDVVNLVPNAGAWAWMVDNAPFFDCPAGGLEETYYFRWWCYRKHIKATPQGRVVTEFITPVNHAGPYNTISCALGHHIAEGRWLRDRGLLDEVLRFWLRSGPDGARAPHLHNFSGWLPAAVWERALVTGDRDGAVELLDALVDDYHAWEAERLLPQGLFWQHDVRDGMEESISGGRRTQNVRPTINSYMVANAWAIARIASWAGRSELATEFQQRGDALRDRAVAAMWDEDAKFFKVRLESGDLSDAREAIGYIPWVFALAGPEHAEAWAQLRDPRGFWAPAGLTTAERRHPAFRTHGVGTCEWDGAVWPFATSQTLTGMARLLREQDQPHVTRADYLDQLLRYAASHRLNGATHLGEYHDEVTGAWLITGPKAERSRYYNHSTFADLIVTGLVGLAPHEGDELVVDPLLPEDAWGWFCLDGVPYHGHELTVVWDRTGRRYGRGPGLTLLVDGQRVANRADLGRLTAKLPPRTFPSREPTPN